MARLRAQPAAEFQAIPGAAEMLDRLRCREDVQLGIATGCWRASAEFKLRTAGIPFGDIPMGTATDALARVEILRIAERKATKTPPEEIVYLGDAEWDVRATNELGWRLIGIGDRCELLRRLGTRDCFPDLREADEILRVITGA